MRPSGVGLGYPAAHAYDVLAVPPEFITGCFIPPNCPGIEGQSVSYECPIGWSRSVVDVADKSAEAGSLDTFRGGARLYRTCMYW